MGGTKTLDPCKVDPTLPPRDFRGAEQTAAG